MYAELRAMAAAQVAGERPGHTLATTALMNEAYLRLTADGGGGFANCRHFFEAGANAMRRILVDSSHTREQVRA